MYSGKVNVDSIISILTSIKDSYGPGISISTLIQLFVMLGIEIEEEKNKNEHTDKDELLEVFLTWKNQRKN